MTAGRRLDPAALERVAAAIAAAERRTSAELAVVVAPVCDPYRHVALLWPALLALALPAALLALAPGLAPGDVYAAQLAAMILGLLAMCLTPVRLALVPGATKRMRARRLAREQFLAQGLDGTEARTGVLLFVALGERHAEILADRGIDGRVPPGTWDGCLARLLEAARAGRLADGLVAAVGAIGDALAEHAPPGGTDRNELPDRLVVL